MELQTGCYKHYKGNKYEVLMTVQHSETQEWMVVYKTLYGEESTWVRPYAMFVENVVVDDIEKPRFEKVKDAE
jgi:hypothetical protein